MATRERKGRRRTAEDELAWWWAMRGTDPLPGKTPPARPEPPPPAKPARAPAAPRVAERPAPVPPKAAPTLHAGKGPGLDRRTLQRLGRGLLPIEATIDLHGLTRVRAHDALVPFLAARQGRERTCVLVVTGHGRRGAEGAGVLRELVPRWLNEPAMRPRVLAFATAQPRHGGDGALYVLLRKKG